MSRWLAQPLAGTAYPVRASATRSRCDGSTVAVERPESGNKPRVPIVPIVPIAPCGRPIGTIGTIGTAPEIEIDERIAMALEGNVPDLYAPAFARMQVGMGSERAVADAGPFLNAWSRQHERLRWGLRTATAGQKKKGVTFPRAPRVSLLGEPTTAKLRSARSCCTQRG